jgi:hypothetical protein
MHDDSVNCRKGGPNTVPICKCAHSNVKYDGTFYLRGALGALKLPDFYLLVWGLPARDHAAQLCCDNGFKRLLVDLRNVDTSGVSTPESAFEFGELLAGDERLKDVRMAHIVPKELISRIDVDFATCIAEIRGRPTGRFIIPEEAVQWLKEQ